MDSNSPIAANNDRRTGLSPLESFLSQMYHHRHGRKGAQSASIFLPSQNTSKNINKRKTLSTAVLKNCWMTVTHVLCPLGTLQVSLLHHLFYCVSGLPASVFSFTPSVLISPQSIAFNCPFDKNVMESGSSTFQWTGYVGALDASS
jgi:hypothetical protein